MSSEKRLVLFMILTFSSVLAIQYVMDVTGLNPPPPKPLPKVQANAKAEDVDKGKAKGKDDPANRNAGGMPVIVAERKGEKPEADKAEAVARPKPVRPEVERAKASELVLGSTRDRSPGAYHLEVQLDQAGAGIHSIESSQYDAEFVEGRGHRRMPLTLLRATQLPALALSVRPAEPVKPPDPEQDEALKDALPIDQTQESPLAETLWEVVRDKDGHAVRTISRVDPVTKAQVEGQEIVFRTAAPELPLKLTKTFRLWKGQDSLSLQLGIESPEKEQSVVYRLFGPSGIPIEGEWYTGTFRDVFFGQVQHGGSTAIDTKPAYDIAKPKPARLENTTLPLHFAGIENQYFTVFVEPMPTPKADADRRESEAVATVVGQPKADELQKADVSFEILSRPVQVGPNHSATHDFTIYAGPKTIESLTPYGAEGLASYRKYQWFGIPGASTMARYVIAPLLDKIYALTAQVARTFGGKAGNYGISIILLTLLVRMIMFPLGRKQALAAKKMQDLQPLLKEIQEKYKDDKERQTKETFALYGKHGVNPVGGCLPALIQLPIFVGLWQALNNSVHLRHASFLYIQNLAAPDMLFKFPTELPLLGNYFNLLPFLVVGLMLVQTKLFSPPATTPEAEMQQKMMKYMMIFMAVMFYKVPSGLGLYFITSSLWQISERLLLPKVSHVAPTPGQAGDDKNLPPGGGRGGPGGGGGGGRGPGGNGAPGKPPGKLAQFWEKVKEEAAKDTTYRNALADRDREKDREKEKPRTRPGRRR